MQKKNQIGILQNSPHGDSIGFARINFITFQAEKSNDEQVRQT